MHDLAPDHEFSVSTHPAGDALTVAVAGQADLHTAPELRTVIGAAIDNGRHRLFVDLTAATFIDSMTLGVLLGALKRLTTVSGKLVIVCPDPHLRRTFEVTSLDRVLALAESWDDANVIMSSPDGAS